MSELYIFTDQVYCFNVDATVEDLENKIKDYTHYKAIAFRKDGRIILLNVERIEYIEICDCEYKDNAFGLENIEMRE